MSVWSESDTYRFETLIARGRSGEVFRALAPDDTPVVIKIHDRADDAEREIARLRAIDHPGVITVLDAGTAPDGRTWLALPWIDGEPLSASLRSGPRRPVAETAHLVQAIGEAVDALHGAGITHGDLAPDNILISPDGHVTVIDLATATPLDPAAIERTAGIELDTTPRYTAPEVAGGRPPGPASDVYAIGLLAYEALTGAFPYPDVSTPIAMLGHHASTEPVAPSEHLPSLPRAIDDVCLWALAKDPADRPQSVRAFADALEHPPDDLRRPRPTGRLFLAATGAIVAVAVILGVLASRSGDDRDVEVEGTAPSTTVSPPTTTLATSTDSDTTVADDATDWPAGRAAGLSCNLLQAPDFDDGVRVDDFYAGDPTNTTAVTEGGLDDTPALAVGADGQFGLYGEVVAIGSHREVVLSAWVAANGAPDTLAAYVDFLDDSFVQITAERDSLGPDQRIGDGLPKRVVIETSVPDGAIYAVPTFFKDGSGGSMIIDELVFGPASTCGDVAS